MIKSLNKTTVERVERPVTILQFGEGNFLRAFADWAIDIANERGVMNDGVVICKPRARSGGGRQVIDTLREQDNLYHVVLEGCQMVLFTTGRGTPFGSVVPTMKISTSTPLARFKSGWIDFDAGPIIEGEKMDDILQKLIAKVLKTANGDRVKHEQVGFKELAIFKSGVTL